MPMIGMLIIIKTHIRGRQYELIHLIITKHAGIEILKKSFFERF